MNVIVQVGNLYNHWIGANYPLGQQAADERLTELANRKTKNDQGIVMVVVDNGKTKIDNSLNDNSNIALRHGLDLGDKLTLIIHNLLSGEGATLSLIAKKMDVRLGGQLINFELEKKSLKIINKLESENAIFKKNEAWFYGRDI